MAARVKKAARRDAVSRRNLLVTLRSAPMAGTRAYREWARTIQSSAAFTRILRAFELDSIEAMRRRMPDDEHFMEVAETRAQHFLLKTFEASRARGEDLKTRAAAIKDAVARAQVAKEILSQYMNLLPHEHSLHRQCSHAEVVRHRDLLERIVNDIDRLAMLGPELWGFSSYNKLVGQRGDHRAFMIRRIDTLIPAQTVHRFAAIAEVMRLSGYPGTSPQHVRSTLMRGRT